MSKKTGAFRLTILTSLLIIVLFAAIAMVNANDIGSQASVLASGSEIQGTPEVTPPVTPLPPNDLIENATIVAALPYTVLQQLPIMTRSASDPAPSCWGFYFNNTLWYRYTPASDQRVLFDAHGSDAQTNKEIAVFSGAPGSLVEVGCSNDADQQAADMNLTAGETYYIMGAAETGGGAHATYGQFALNADVVPLVPNDEFASATVINALPFSTQQNIYGATFNPSDPPIQCQSDAHSYDSNSVWFQYTSPIAQSIVVNAKPSNFGGNVSIFTGSADNLTQIACSSNQLQMLPTPFAAQAGVTYSIKISQFDNTPLHLPGYMSLNISAFPLVTNDEFANATVVSTLPFTDNVDVYAATAAPTDPTVLSNCLYSPKAAYPNTIWYQYTAATSQSLTISAQSNPSYYKLIVMFTQQDGNLTQFACSGTDFLTAQVQAGVTYYVMIASEQNYGGGGVTPLPLDHSTPLQVSFSLPPVANDLIQNATVVNSFPFTMTQNVYSSTLSPDEPLDCEQNFISNSVWFQYTPSQNRGIIADTLSSDYDTVVKIYTRGAGNALVLQGCGLGSVGMQVQSGVTYLFMIANLQNSSEPPLTPTDQLRLTISAPVVANDLLENLITIPGLPYSNTQDVLGATSTTNEPKSTSTTPDCLSHASYDLNRVNTVWYQYTATTTQTLLIDTRSSDYPTFIDLPDLNLCGYGVRTFQAQAGTTYRIKIAYQLSLTTGFMPPRQSSVLRFILQPPPVANDVQADAISINTVPFTYTEDVTHATVDLSEPSGYDCGLRTQSVWFLYEPEANQTVLVDTSGSNYNTVIALYRGNSNGGCAPIKTSQGQVKLTLNAGAGYYIAIMNRSDIPAASATLHLLITETTSSHAFENARVIPTSALTYEDIQDLGNAKNNFTAPYIICNSLPDNGYQNTMWYRYTPALDMQVSLSSIVTSSEIIANVYDASNMHMITCDHGWAYRSAAVNFTALAGKSYAILIGEDTHMVSGNETWINQLDFNASVSARPANLNISGTISTVNPVFTWTPLIGAEQYKWTITPSGGSASIFNVDLANCTDTLCSFTLPNALALGQYLWSVQGWNSQIGYSLSAAQSFIIAEPLITTPPQDQTITTGQTAMLSVVAAGDAPLSYQWYQGTAPSTANPVGTNAASFTTPTLTTATSYWVRVSNTYGHIDSDTAVISIDSNLLLNDDFSAGMSGWLTFGNITSRVNNGVFEFYYNTAQGNVRPSLLQAIPTAFNAGASLELSVELGNSSALRKRALVFIVNQDWTDLQTCSFWLEPHAPLRTYVLQGRPTTNWASAQVAIYANPADNTGWLQVDNVNFHKLPGSSVAQTLCIDPTAPAAGSGGDSSNLIVNGGFSAGMSNWITFGNIASRVNGGVFEFFHNTTLGTVRPSVLQNTGTALAAHTPVELQLQLGNSSAVRKRALVILFQYDWTDLQMCSFWIPPNTALDTYVMQTTLPSAWSNASVSIYANPADNIGWLQVDNISLKSRPSLAITGTNCYEPGAGAAELSAMAEVLPSETPSMTETSTEMATEMATEAVDSLTEVATEEVIEEVTEAPTLPTAIVDLPTALPFPTLPPPATPTELPTALPFPTLPSPATPTELPTTVPLSLPAVVRFDDGASDWLHTENWQLASHETGLAWFMTSTTRETLRWQQQIDLRGVQANVALSFQSQFVGDGAATVQISTDAGVTWQPISLVSASDDWATVSVDLSAYRGSLIEIEFVWQDTHAETTDQWAVDNIIIDTLTPTLVPSEETGTPTAVSTEATEDVSLTDPAADSGLMPTDVPTSEVAVS